MFIIQITAVPRRCQAVFEVQREVLGQVPSSAPDCHQEHRSPTPSRVPLLLPSSAEGRWMEGATAEMTGTQLLITCLWLNTLNSHFPTVLRSPCPHSQFSAAVSSTQQLNGSKWAFSFSPPHTSLLHHSPLTRLSQLWICLAIHTGSDYETRLLPCPW